MHLVLQLKISEENCLNLAWDQTKSMLNSVCVCVVLCQCVGLLMALFRITCFLNYTGHISLSLLPAPFPYYDISSMDYMPSLPVALINKPW